jgi:hypothetical protein
MSLTFWGHFVRFQNAARTELPEEHKKMFKFLAVEATLQFSNWLKRV